MKYLSFKQIKIRLNMTDNEFKKVINIYGFHNKKPNEFNDRDIRRIENFNKVEEGRTLKDIRRRAIKDFTHIGGGTNYDGSSLIKGLERRVKLNQ